MKKESRPQKTSISVMKRVFSGFLAVAVVLICSICILDATALAAVSMDGHFINAVVSDYTNGTLQSDGASNIYGNLYFGSTNQNIGFCTIGGQLYGISNNITNFATLYSGTINTWDVNTGVTLEGETYYYGYNNTNTGVLIGGENYQNYAYTSINYAIAAYAQYTPGPPPESGNSLNISLPAGNILIADISNTGSNPYYLETTSGTTGAVVRPGMNNIQIGYSNSVPATFTVPNSSWEYPSWSGTGSSSVLGTYNRQSTQGDFALSNTNAQKYVIITNPMYPNDNNASANRLNSDLNITIEKVNSYVIYSLQTGYVSGNLIGTNDGSQYIDYQYDEDTGEWVGTNQDGNPASPVWGGQNDFENTPTTINDWLENIAHQISSFFSGAIGAINTLSVAVKNFAGTLMSLYVWLPSPVLSILSSAVMLAIVIGVIKVFI